MRFTLLFLLLFGFANVNGQAKKLMLKKPGQQENFNGMLISYKWVKVAKGADSVYKFVINVENAKSEKVVFSADVYYQDDSTKTSLYEFGDIEAKMPVSGKAPAAFDHVLPSLNNKYFRFYLTNMKVESDD